MITARVLLLLLVSLPAWGADWFVRPAEDNDALTGASDPDTEYGLENGTSYANAFDGFADVTWGVGQVHTGDTLYVCGTFDRDSIDGGQTMLLIEAAGVTINGDCSAQGDLSRAMLYGETTQDYGIFCNSNATCLGTTIRNIVLQKFDLRAIYIRNDLNAVAVANFVGDNILCTDVLGAEANFPQCISGWGSNATLTNIRMERATDDLLHWEGDDFTIRDWVGIHPASGITSQLGDCVQVAIQGDNAKVQRGFCDHRNHGSKQCIVVQGDVADDNAEISDTVCLMPPSDGVHVTNGIFYGIPNTTVARNYIFGARNGIWAEPPAHSSRVFSNVLRGQYLRGIIIPSTLTAAGTHLVFNNSVSESGQHCAFMEGGASVSIELRNNAFANCGTAAVLKGGSSTITATNNSFWNSPTNCTGLTCTSSITADPQFIGGPNPTTADGFRPRAGSPLVRSGTYVGPILDFRGRPFALKPSIGAFEFDRPTQRIRR